MANDVIEGDGDLADRVEDTAWRMALPQVVFQEFSRLYEGFRSFEVIQGIPRLYCTMMTVADRTVLKSVGLTVAVY